MTRCSRVAECIVVRRDRAPARQQERALKHGLYTREAVEERRQLRALIRQSRMLIQEIE
jgi:hypothetical protein